MAGPGVCIRALRICSLIAGARGLDLEPILSRHGLGPDVLADPLARIPHKLVVALWTELPERCGDPDLGLHAAEASQDLALDVLDYAAQSCSTVGQTMECMRRYIHILHDAARVRIETEGDVGRYVQEFVCEPAVPRAFFEFILARWVLRLRRTCAGPVPLRELVFPHARPASLAEHERVLGLPLRFGAPHGAIVFDRELLERRLRVTVPISLDADVLERRVEEMALEVERPAGPPNAPDVVIVHRARRIVADLLPSGPPGLDELARRLGLSSRSLQRRLQEAGTTFAQVVDATRRELALRHLQDRRLSLTEIAFLTGFADASAFHRAFRRWTGTTPREHRRG
ncbi:MAG: AraC family transcriptional regulator [Polyangia bacterium]